MRLDLTVNMLTFQALKNKKITVFGGKQKRPNVHVDDIINAYIFFIKNKKIKFGIFNIGFENLSILQIAKKISKKIKSKIIIKKNYNDARSYNLDSTKLLKTGFKPRKNINDAIYEIKELYFKRMKKKYGDNWEEFLKTGAKRFKTYLEIIYNYKKEDMVGSEKQESEKEVEEAEENEDNEPNAVLYEIMELLAISYMMKEFRRNMLTDEDFEKYATSENKNSKPEEEEILGNDDYDGNLDGISELIKKIAKQLSLLL